MSRKGSSGGSTRKRKFQRKQTSRLQSDSGTSGFMRKFRTKKKFLKGYKKVLAPQILNAVTQQRVTATVSQQTVTQILAYTGSGAVTAPLQCLLAKPDITDMMAIIASTEATPATQGSANNTTGQTRRLLVEEVHAQYRIKNQTNIPVKITLYDCVSRRDQSSGATVLPEASWRVGVTEESVTLAGNANSNALLATFPGATPFQSQLFCQIWKVGKVTNFTLHPGSEHQHHVRLRPGGMLNNAYVSRFDCLKGLTYCLMAVVEGGLVQDTTLPFNITLGSGEVDFVTTTKYRFTALEKSRTAYTQYSSLPAAITVQGTVLEDTDAVATQSQV